MFISIAIQVTVRKSTVGDVVCVYKDKALRQLWSMGVVKSLIIGRDSYHRGAVVRVRIGDRVVEMTRPLHRLYYGGPQVQRRNKKSRQNTFQLAAQQNKFAVK